MNLTCDTLDVVQLARVRRLTKSGAAKAIRIGAGLSLPELAAAVGVSPVTVWRWEGGVRVPHGARALAYGRLLDRLSGVQT